MLDRSAASRLVLVLMFGFLPWAAHADSYNCGWSGALPSSKELDGLVHTMVVYDDGSGPALFVGGTFVHAGSLTVNRIAKWNGSSWSALGAANPGITSGAAVFTLSVYDDGSGSALYVGGSFTQVGGFLTANNVAKWKSGSWSTVGTGLHGSGSVAAYTSAVWDDPNVGDGPELYMGGSFTVAGSVINAYRIARWDGSDWSAVGSGMDDYVNALAVFDDDGDGPRASALYAGGGFIIAGVAANRVARWDGTSWTALKDNVIQYGVNSTANDMFVYDDDGSGPHLARLYVCGHFTTAGSVNPANRIASWGRDSVGSALYWASLGTGLDLPAYSLTVFDPSGDGSAPALYVGGVFTQAGGSPATSIAQWNGTNWFALDDGLESDVRALAVFDDDGAGSQPSALFAAGDITSPVQDIGKWVCGSIFLQCDLDGDCDVDLTDLAQLLGHYGMTGVSYTDGDVFPEGNGDGVVNLADLGEMVGHYGDSCQ